MNNTTNRRLLLAILFSFLAVVWVESVAVGDLLQAPNKSVLQSFARETTELGGPLTREGVVSGLRGTTRRADEIADAIESGHIRVEFLDDDVFARAYRTLQPKGDVPNAFQAFDDLIYIRKSSPTPLSDIVHEGSHVLQRMKGFQGTRLVAEIQAHLYERFFRKALGLPSRFTTESLEMFIKRVYEDFADFLDFSN